MYVDTNSPQLNTSCVLLCVGIDRCGTLEASAVFLIPTHVCMCARGVEGRRSSTLTHVDRTDSSMIIELLGRDMRRNQGAHFWVARAGRAGSPVRAYVPPGFRATGSIQVGQLVPSFSRYFAIMFAAVRYSAVRRSVMRAFSTAKNPSVRGRALCCVFLRVVLGIGERAAHSPSYDPLHDCR